MVLQVYFLGSNSIDGKEASIVKVPTINLHTQVKVKNRGLNPNNLYLILFSTEFHFHKIKLFEIYLK